MEYKLKTIAFHITDNCCAHCPMCYENAQRSSDLDGEFETLKKIAHNAIANGKAEQFLIVGGDPCEHPHLIELMRYIKEEGKKYNLNPFIEVLSNTHDYKENGKIVPMEEVVKLVDKMNVTLHGETPTMHDLFNGVKGSYVHVLDNIKRFVELKSDEQSVGVTVNVMPHTVDSINQIVFKANLILNGAVEDVCVQRIAPVGRACGSIKYFIEKQDLDTLMPLLADIDRKGIALDVCDCFPFCSIKPEYRHLLPKGGCSWGKEVISVKPNGDITRCALSSNILSKNMLELDTEEKFFDWWNNDPELKSFREGCHLTEVCHKCNKYKECGGGCVLARPTGDPYKGGKVEKGNDYLSSLENSIKEK